MKKITKLILIISMSVVCVVLATGLILGLVTIKPIDKMGGYDRADVLTSYETVQGDASKQKKVGEALDTVKFSVLKAVFSGNTKYKIQGVETKDEEGDTVRVTKTAAAFKDFRPIGDQFMIRFSYDSVKTNDRFVDENGCKIRYDRVVMIITKGNDEITDVKLYPYLVFNMNNQLDIDEPNEDYHVGTEYYEVYEFTAKMYTYKMFNILDEHFTAGGGGIIA